MVPVTPQVYQIYAKRPPEEVHTLLRAVGADYVILEDSICYERRHPRGCRLRDLLDVANGHVSTRLPPALAPAPGACRACWESRAWSPPHAGPRARGRRGAGEGPARPPSSRQTAPLSQRASSKRLCTKLVFKVLLLKSKRNLNPLNSALPAL